MAVIGVGRMPIVLVTTLKTESGHTYADVTGVSYEYPKRYRNIIQPGEEFVYQRGVRQPNGKRQPAVYFGTGVIGRVFVNPDDPSRYRCEVINYVEFDVPLPLVDSNNVRFESGGERRGFYQPGVRRISVADFDRLLKAAGIGSGPITHPAPVRD